VLEDTIVALAGEVGEKRTRVLFELDVTSEGNWSHVVADVESAFGSVDARVENAGIIMFKDNLETTQADYERVLAVNLVDEFLGIKAVAPGMIARGGGSIVNIASVDGLKGPNGLGAYASSNGACNRLTKGRRHGIRSQGHSRQLGASWGRRHNHVEL
jgi:3alpha(or 20beta)-hydroxysteroid dehydrogenase